MKYLIIAFACLVSIHVGQAQNIAPFENGNKEILSLKSKKDFRLPVSILRSSGGMASSVMIKSFDEVQLFKSAKTKENSSNLAHLHFTKSIKQNGFVEIFRCKDDCKNILNLIISKLLPINSQESEIMKKAKRYSYAIFHKKESIGIVITIHSNTTEVMTLVGFSNLK